MVNVVCEVCWCKYNTYGVCQAVAIEINDAFECATATYADDSQNEVE